MEYPHSALSVLPDCSAVSLEETLADLLTETVSSVQYREQNELNRLLSRKNGRCVLFGAGNMGCRAQDALRLIGIHPLCVSDNNPELWGTWLGEIQILPPEEAAARFGDNAHFFITIRNEHHWYRETFNRLSSLGCTGISSAEPIAWRFPEQFPPFLAYDLPHKIYAQANHVLDAANLWADEASCQEYSAHIRLRALGDPSGLPKPAVEESYFLDGAFQAEPGDTFLDCGAFDGDTVRAMIARQPDFGAIHAIEADSNSFTKLRTYVDGLGPALRNKIQLHSCAVGSQRGHVKFENDGTITSKISDAGPLTVELFPIDELCAAIPLSFIKMDIEGAEFDALMGAKNVIQRDRPILAICVYHSQNDLWRIPLLIRSFYPDYRMYLKSYSGDGIQTVAYAVPPERVP